MVLIDYLAELTYGMIILWCFLIWYIYFVFKYFDPAFDIWLRSFGIALFVGFALNINSFGTIDAILQADQFQVFRFFLIPFCVSSFPALLKGKGLLIFSLSFKENSIATVLCLIFIGFVEVCKIIV